MRRTTSDDRRLTTTGEKFVRCLVRRQGWLSSIEQPERKPSTNKSTAGQLVTSDRRDDNRRGRQCEYQRSKTGNQEHGAATRQPAGIPYWARHHGRQCTRGLACGVATHCQPPSLPSQDAYAASSIDEDKYIKYRPYPIADAHSFTLFTL